MQPSEKMFNEYYMIGWIDSSEEINEELSSIDDGGED